MGTREAEYDIVTGPSWAILKTLVNARLEDGGLPLGGPCFWRGHASEIWAQAVVIRAKETPEGKDER
jgi:hypothetical protein